MDDNVTDDRHDDGLIKGYHDNMIDNRQVIGMHDGSMTRFGNCDVINKYDKHMKFGHDNMRKGHGNMIDDRYDDMVDDRQVIGMMI